MIDLNWNIGLIIMKCLKQRTISERILIFALSFE